MSVVFSIKFSVHCGWTDSPYLSILHHTHQKRGSSIPEKYFSLHLILCLDVLGDVSFCLKKMICY